MTGCTLTTSFEPLNAPIPTSQLLCIGTLMRLAIGLASFLASYSAEAAGGAVASWAFREWVVSEKNKAKRIRERQEIVFLMSLIYGAMYCRIKSERSS